MKTFLKHSASIMTLFLAAILSCLMLVACSDEPDAPTPDPEPDTEDNQPKEWGDITPFYLIDSVTGIKLEYPITEDGFFYNENHNVDYFVINHDYVVAPPNTSKYAKREPNFLSLVLRFLGTHVSPVENEERYNAMCKRMGAKPICELNDSIELGDLPFYKLRQKHTMETVNKIDIYVDRNPTTGEKYDTPQLHIGEILFYPTASKIWIETFLNVVDPHPNEPIGIPLKYITILEGYSELPSRKNYITWFDERWGAWLYMPEVAGIYNYTVKVYLTNGKVFEDSVKVRFLPEGTEYPD